MNEYLLIALCALSSFAFRYLSAVVFRKSGPRMAILQAYMPMLIMFALVALLYRGLDYASAPFALDYLIAGIIALFVCALSKSSVAGIIVSTAAFVLMHDYLF